MSDSKAPNVGEDAKALRSALNVMISANEQKLYGVIAHRTNEHMKRVCLAYKEEFKRDLISDIKSKTRSDFERIMVALAMPAADYDAWLLHEAFSGIGSDKAMITEILCTRTTAQLVEIAAAYSSKYNQDLYQRVQGESGGALRAIYNLMLDGKREEGGDNLVQTHVTVLGRGWDQKVFIQHLAGYCREHAEKIAAGYMGTQGEPFIPLLKKKASGNIEDALVCLATPTAEWYADKLIAAFKAIGVDDDVYIRIIGTQKDNLAAISAVLKAKTDKTLNEWIEQKSHHHTKRAITAMFMTFCPAT